MRLYAVDSAAVCNSGYSNAPKLGSRCRDRTIGPHQRMDGRVHPIFCQNIRRFCPRCLMDDTATNSVSSGGPTLAASVHLGLSCHRSCGTARGRRRRSETCRHDRRAILKTSLSSCLLSRRYEKHCHSGPHFQLSYLNTRGPHSLSHIGFRHLQEQDRQDPTCLCFKS